MKLKSEGRWVLLRKPDLCVERSAEPTKLDLDAAVDWVRKNRPMLWVGSVFSVPQPSGFPSGYALTRSLLDLIFPAGDGVPPSARETLINGLIGKWPLERLLDEFEMLGYDLSESLLDFFAERDRSAGPNPLHEAVVRYYEQGLSTVPVCVTTNWDTLLEKAFRANAFTVRTGGPGAMPAQGFDKAAIGEKLVSIYHPHGSFETKDVICSYVREQQQLTLYFQILMHPTLFLGYSGYEPSLYRHLEHNSGQLWSVRNESDFSIPAKRRLPCRPNAYVYLGDMRELLKALGLLDRDVSLESNHLARDAGVPPKVLEVIRLGIAAELKPRLCIELLRDIVFTHYDEPEVTFRFIRILRAIDNHIRNRAADAELPVALMAATRFRDDEQIWYGLLSYLLRFSPDLHDSAIQRLLRNANRARRAGGLRHSKALQPFVRARSRCYKAYLGQPERTDDDASAFMLSQYSGMILGDLALSGELAEVAAFTCLRKDEIERAKGYFDTAATYYYLTGLWKGGQLSEWANNNIEALKRGVPDKALRMPPEAYNILRGP